MSLTKPLQPYAVTTSRVLYWFNRTNRIIFNYEVPKPRSIIFTERGISMWGACYPSESKSGPMWWDLKVMRTFPTFVSFIECLTHEMVHAHCYWYATEEFIQPGHRGHGKTFFGWRPRLAEYGIHLSGRMLSPEKSKSNTEMMKIKLS